MHLRFLGQRIIFYKLFIRNLEKLKIPVNFPNMFFLSFQEIPHRLKWNIYVFEPSRNRSHVHKPSLDKNLKTTYSLINVLNRQWLRSINLSRFSFFFLISLNEFEHKFQICFFSLMKFIIEKCGAKTIARVKTDAINYKNSAICVKNTKLMVQQMKATTTFLIVLIDTRW